MTAPPPFDDLRMFGDVIDESVSPRLGRAMTGGGDKSKRHDNDYYPTPADVTRALLRAESVHLQGGTIWEPCGRGGAIIRELRAVGFDTVGSDIVADPTHDVVHLDILQADAALSARAITNPPFNIAAEIIAHLLGKLDLEYLALLLKSQFWHAETRRALFNHHRPARIYALTWRPDFTFGGAPTMECQWCVWDRRHVGSTSYDVLARDDDRQADLFAHG